MSEKLFKFAVEDLASHARARCEAVGDTLDAAARKAFAALPEGLAATGAGLRFFRIGMRNTRTGEFAAIVGQGRTALEAWADALKLTNDSFRPKNDGRQRASFGLTVQLAPRADDPEAVCRPVARSLAQFEGDESHEQEQARIEQEAHAKEAGETKAAA